MTSSNSDRQLYGSEDNMNDGFGKVPKFHGKYFRLIQNDIRDRGVETTLRVKTRCRRGHIELTVHWQP